MKIKIRGQPLVSALLVTLFLATMAILLASSTLPVFAQEQITLKQWTSGSISYSNPSTLYEFYGTAGQRVTVRMERDDDYPRLDPWLDLKDPYGNVIVSDDDSAGSGNSQISGYYLRRTGWYTIVARSYNNQSYGAYWIYATVYR
jgi:hypothetical protein